MWRGVRTLQISFLARRKFNSHLTYHDDYKSSFCYKGLKTFQQPRVLTDNLTSIAPAFGNSHLVHFAWPPPPSNIFPVHVSVTVAVMSHLKYSQHLPAVLLLIV